MIKANSRFSFLPNISLEKVKLIFLVEIYI